MTTPVNDVTAKQPAEQPPGDPKFDQAVANAQQQQASGAGQIAQMTFQAILPMMMMEFHRMLSDSMSEE
jgi:hypothetical protein